MTPRSLVTAIGATAMACAVVIGAASMSSGAPSPQHEAAVAIASLEHEARQGAPERLAAGPDACLVAL